ncbi:porin family protein [Bradyrhizobium sp. LHD-71]|uniref:outer membrane protein n=1 Tax=Bradyrhizobium sp. LHD-71 TaxID=3072141 RepID=UPI00280D2343|nr:porin family protein [Bradyrhizobium sp. LHD-71]MDQ8726383.1 porin family protein [Bradyrhizobium sp. LHD-71]
MKKLVLAAAALAVFGTTASAADLSARMPLKAPPVVSPAINWSGFYAGAMGGYGVSDEVSASIPGVGGVSVSSSDLDGGFVGGTIGYNWQAPGSQFVFGIEVDAAWSDISYSENFGFGVTAEDRIEALGSVTGRLGVAFNSVLLYAKGGYAWGINEISASSVGVTLSESQTHHGWTVGAGVEWMFLPNWSLKGEYMYVDLGDANYLTSALLPTGVDLGVTLHTGKVGVNYRF